MMSLGQHSFLAIVFLLTDRSESYGHAKTASGEVNRVELERICCEELAPTEIRTVYANDREG